MAAYHYVTKMPRITLTFVSCQTMTYFHTLPNPKVFKYKMLLVLIFNAKLCPKHLMCEGLSQTLL